MISENLPNLTESLSNVYYFISRHPWLRSRVTRRGAPAIERPSVHPLTIRLHGAQFDMAYTTQLVGGHEMTLNTIGTTLLPNARDPQMREMLQIRAKPAVVQHPQRAWQILAGM